MAKTKIDRQVMKTINEFIAKVAMQYKIDSVYLFGSHAKGTTHEWSDIDLAIISPDIKDRIIDMANMFGYTWGLNANIEPHPYNTKDFQAQDGMVVREILRTGIKII